MFKNICRNSITEIFRQCDTNKIVVQRCWGHSVTKSASGFGRAAVHAGRAVGTVEEPTPSSYLVA